jgi:hypothetical protein
MLCRTINNHWPSFGLWTSGTTAEANQCEPLFCKYELCMEDLHKLTFATANKSEEVWMRTNPSAILFMMCLLAENTSILDKEAHFSTGWLLVSNHCLLPTILVDRSDAASQAYPQG